jgi:outer membrane murein-binding lipoprotein Lpp
MILTFTLMVAGCSQDSEKVTKLQVEKEKLAAQIADLQKEQEEQKNLAEANDKASQTANDEGNLEFKGKIAKSYEESKEWWAPKKRPPEGAPNVIIFLLDDTGFAQIGSFGGLVHTPNIDKLADNGLRYNNFHTTSYFEEHYEEDNDDVPISEFAGDQGELWIDHDFMEFGFTTLPSSIAELVTGHSWSDEYVDELTKRVAKNGMSRFNSFAFVTAGNVKNPISVTKEGVELHFMGQFTIRT